MRKLIVSLVLVAGLALFGAASVLAAISDTVSGSVTLTGTPFVDVTQDTITWSLVTLGVTDWKAADSLLEVKYLLQANGALCIYTTNAGDKVGLIGADGSALPMAWRVFNTLADSAIPGELTIHEWLYDETVENKDLNGDGDKLDKYVSKLTNQDPKPLSDSIYPCWLWMKDGPPVSPLVDTYYAVEHSVKGMQHAEGSWGDWGGSPDYVAISVNFTKGLPQAYTTAIELKLYSL